MRTNDQLNAMTLDELADTVANEVYVATCAVFENAEHRGLICGHGHHMAQKAAQQAKAFFLERKK